MPRRVKGPAQPMGGGEVGKLRHWSVRYAGVGGDPRVADGSGRGERIGTDANGGKDGGTGKGTGTAANGFPGTGEPTVAEGGTGSGTNGGTGGETGKGVPSTCPFRLRFSSCSFG